MARKPDIGILLGMGKPKGGESEGGGNEMGQAVLDAIEAKDAAALEAALEDCWREWDSTEPHEEAGEEPMAEEETE